MGEYAIYQGEEVKIGTCRDMYYLRWEDRFKVEPLSHSIDPAHTDCLRFRLPFPEEDGVPVGGYTPYNLGVSLYRAVETERGYSTLEYWADPETKEDAGVIQLRHPSGLLLSVNCYHGQELPVVGYDVRSASWNGKTHAFELTAVKVEGGKLYAVVTCQHCGHVWRYDLAEMLPWVPDEELRRRLAAYLEEVQP